MKLSQPSTFSDPLTEVLRSGARSLLARAVEAEVAGFLDGHSEARTEEGRRRLVRHGHLPEREIMTGIGPVAVRAPRVRDRTGQGAERIRFSSALLPPYARRSKSLEVPVLYLKGISTGDFAAALAALLGPDAGGLSASTVARLTEVWADQHAHWLKRDLSARHYVYFWADGIHVQARLEDDAQCLLVIIGATPEGKKELVGLIDGVRESAQSWRELLLDLKRRGLAVAPELAIADGALGFWKAIEDVWPRTRSQRCWVGDDLGGALPALGIALAPPGVVLERAGQHHARDRGLDEVRIGVGDPLGRVADLVAITRQRLAALVVADRQPQSEASEKGLVAEQRRHAVADAARGFPAGAVRHQAASRACAPASPKYPANCWISASTSRLTWRRTFGLKRGDGRSVSGSAWAIRSFTSSQRRAS